MSHMLALASYIAEVTGATLLLLTEMFDLDSTE